MSELTRKSLDQLEFEVAQGKYTAEQLFTKMRQMISTPKQPHPAMTQGQAKAAYLLTHSVGKHIAQPAAVDRWSMKTRKNIEQWMHDSIADATQCEDADQDIPFANAIGDLLNLLSANPSPATVSAGAVSSELTDVMNAVFFELENREDRNGNAPGHSHSIPGIWDSDNGKLAGKPCAWCAL